MSAMRSGDGPGEEGKSASWATEALPLAVRKELLERDLQRLGTRAPQAPTQSNHHETQDGGHPQAAAAPVEHGA